MSVPLSQPFKPPPMLLRTRHESPGTVVVAVAGEVDMATAPALHTALLDALAVYTPANLEVDLSACTFLDCSGLRVFIATRTCALAAGSQLWISSPQPMVHMVLEVTGLLNGFTRPSDNTGQAANGPAEALALPALLSAA